MLPISIFSQPTNLTDREVMIQMYEKIIYIEETIGRIDDNSKATDYKIAQTDSRVTKNEMNIDTFFERLKELVARWNVLLSLFATFILGIFAWMWRSVSYRKHNTQTK